MVTVVHKAHLKWQTQSGAFDALRGWNSDGFLFCLRQAFGMTQ